MSKAFQSEEASAGSPLVAAALPPLPAGVPNYVTPRGLRRLRAEAAKVRAELALARDRAEAERARTDVLAERLGALEERVSTAHCVSHDPGAPASAVRFGARVRLRHGDGREAEVRLVGVDEAEPASARVAFTAPLARALLGAVVGEERHVRTPRGEDRVEVLGVTYDDE